MARVAYPLARSSPSGEVAIAESALEALQCEADPQWSIDREPMGPGWRDSSWMLRKVLDAIEGVPTSEISVRMAMALVGGRDRVADQTIAAPAGLAVRARPMRNPPAVSARRAPT